ncbi:MAG: DUF4258 domain-containing protein [Deltaproteobacteria bacterium]|nr:DUF4258 domain-containing protein [Deltaproteobacteria bacterium]
MKIIFTEHAKFEALRRGIAEDLIISVIERPQQRLMSKKGRIIAQSKYYDKIEGKEMLLRVVVIESAGNYKVITVYKTSRSDKYWIKGG